MAACQIRSSHGWDAKEEGGGVPVSASRAFSVVTRVLLGSTSSRFCHLAVVPGPRDRVFNPQAVGGRLSKPWHPVSCSNTAVGFPASSPTPALWAPSHLLLTRLQHPPRSPSFSVYSAPVEHLLRARLSAKDLSYLFSFFLLDPKLLEMKSSCFGFFTLQQLPPCLLIELTRHLMIEI